MRILPVPTDHIKEILIVALWYLDAKFLTSLIQFFRCQNKFSEEPCFKRKWMGFTFVAVVYNEKNIQKHLQYTMELRIGRLIRSQDWTYTWVDL